MVLVTRVVAVAVMAGGRGPAVGEVGLASLVGVVGKPGAGGYPARGELVRHFQPDSPQLISLVLYQATFASDNCRLTRSAAAGALSDKRDQPI